jgi:hypothetical protein
VNILWKDTALHVSHLTPPRSFYVGEEEGKNFKCDYFIPAEKIGTTRAPVVLADRSGSVAVVLPRATGWVDLPGQPRMTLEQASNRGAFNPAQSSRARRSCRFLREARRTSSVDGIVFEVAVVNAGRKVAGALTIDTPSLLYTGLSFLAHAGLLAAMAFFMPPLGATDDEGIGADQQYLIQQYLNAAAEKEMEEKETEQVSEANADNKEGGTGTRAKGEEGSMGNPNTKATGQSLRRPGSGGQRGPAHRAPGGPS